MQFDIGVVLSITHEILLTDMGNIYKILNYMLDEDLYTHQLPRAAKIVKHYILEIYPELKQWDNYYKAITPDNWKEYLELAENMFGKILDIPKAPKYLWEHKPPINELIDLLENKGD